MVKSWEKGEIMVINCLNNQITDTELFSFLGDRYNNNTGLHLEEDAHIVILKDEDKVIARWSIAGVTMEEILDTATQYINDNHSNLDRRLVLFWQQHPKAKFNLEAIAGAIDATKANIKERIKSLTEYGIVEEHHNGGSSPLYSLHCDKQPNDLFAQLTELTYDVVWQQSQKIQGEAALA
jgi:hypothetical protein